MNSLLGKEKLQVLGDLVKTASKNGIFIEVGVFNGGSLKCIAENTPNKVYGFDTFEGMPEEFFWLDEFHKPKEFTPDYSFSKMQASFKDLYPNVTLVKGLFPFTATAIDGRDISFAHLDMDHWRGTLAALLFIWPKMLPGGIVLFDDYDWVNCPGITPIVQTWAMAKGLKLGLIEDSPNQIFLVKP